MAGISILDYSNGMMRDMPTFKIVPDSYKWHNTWDILKSRLNREDFHGDVAEVKIRTSRPRNAQAWGPQVPMPQGGKSTFVTQFLPLKSVIAGAMIEGAAMRRVRKPDAWLNALQDALDMRQEDFLWLMELVALGDGTGRLARVNHTSAGDVAVASTSYVKIGCDNTYADFGSENVQNIQVGMWVELYAADGTRISDGASVYKWQVTAVSFGNRNNGTYVVGSAGGTGYFTIACAGGTEATAVHDALTDGSVVFVANTSSLVDAYSLRDMISHHIPASGTSATGVQLCYQAYHMLGSANVYCPLPMGLLSIIQDSAATNAYTDGAIDCTLDTFQGLARVTYPQLNARIYTAVDFADGTHGTPADWGISTISGAFADRARQTGKRANCIICSPEMAAAIYTRNKASNNISVQVSDTRQLNKLPVGTRIAREIMLDNDEIIPIQTSLGIPQNVLYALDLDALHWYAPNDFDEIRPGGDVWCKTPDLIDNYYAPYGGDMQLGAERCDTSFAIHDLRVDV